MNQSPIQKPRRRKRRIDPNQKASDAPSAPEEQPREQSAVFMDEEVLPRVSEDIEHLAERGVERDQEPGEPRASESEVERAGVLHSDENPTPCGD